jgi:hypothetical protein
MPPERIDSKVFVQWRGNSLTIDSMSKSTITLELAGSRVIGGACQHLASLKCGQIDALERVA